MSRWSEADLEARLCRALDLAGKTVHCFARDGYTDKGSPLLGFGPEKPIAETAMLIYAASAASRRPSIASRIDELARLLGPHARSERVLVDITLHPTQLFKLAVPHVLLTRLGYCDAGFDDFLRSCARSQAAHGQDRPSSASLERRWISSLWDGSEKAAGWRAVLLDSVLNWPLDIMGGLRDDAYAFTHLVFYCTDFGFRRCRLPRRRPVILAEAGSLLARYMDAEDYDLAGEILLTWPLVGSAWGPSAAFGFRLLASVEDQVGVLPCGNVDLARLAQMTGEERARYALGTAYHTAYVMGFLCAAALRPGRAPPAEIIGPRFEKSCLARLLRYVGNEQGHWQPEFAKLAEAEQQALAPLVLDITLMQRARGHDYEAVKEIISLASEYDMAGSPLSVQAVELLGRIGSGSVALGRRQAAE